MPLCVLPIVNPVRAAICGLFLFLSFVAFAQNSTSVAPCGTLQRLEAKLKADPALQARFFQQRDDFNQKLFKPELQNKIFGSLSTVLVPVVFHVVLQNPADVPDAVLQAQLDTLNKDFAGTNGDSVKIPSYFKPLFGRSAIQFCLAKRTPDGDPATGIVRVITTKKSFGLDDSVKHSATGGDDAWDTERYLNVWVCDAGYIAYATFPGDGSPAEQGLVVDYRSLPGGSYAVRNGGKTLSHEAGHYFNLYHIWGNGGNACAETDYVDDTPGQTGPTLGCPTGVVTDACTPTGNGIMYQNYMDYSNDPCLVMFTAQQVVRMEAALSVYRPSLLSSNGCGPGALRAYDAKLEAVLQPVQRICTTGFVPEIRFRNIGTQPLTSLFVQAQVDNGAATATNWMGNLPQGQSITVTLNAMTAASGDHLLTVYVSQPNWATDENKANDTLTMRFQNVGPVTTVDESFEGTIFPPAAWDIVNREGDRTWQRTTAAAKTGAVSAVIENFNYYHAGRRDDLRLPAVRIMAGIDSAFLSFQLAAALRYNVGAGAVTDTLEVMASTDCGSTFQSLYKKWGIDLQTVSMPVTAPFVPSATEWRRDSVNLSGYIGADSLWLLFRNTTRNQNTVYLDDVRLRTATTNLATGLVNPSSQTVSFVAMPNPTTGKIVLRFSGTAGLRSVQLFTFTGQKIAEATTGVNRAANEYRFDLGRYASGIYVVKAVFAGKILTQKIAKF